MVVPPPGKNGDGFAQCFQGAPVGAIDDVFLQAGDEANAMTSGRPFTEQKKRPQA